MSTSSTTLTAKELTNVYNLYERFIDLLTEDQLKLLFVSCNYDLDRTFKMIKREIINSLYTKVPKVISDSVFQNDIYFEKLSSTLEELLRVESLTYFVTSVMPEFEISTHHIEWFDVAQFYKRFCILAARDHGKSWTFSIAYPCWKLYRFNAASLSKNLNVLSKEGYIFSNSFQQVKKLIKSLKEFIEFNNILKNKLMPDDKDGWASTEIFCKNGASIIGKSMLSSIRGAHPGWIMVDDCMKDNVIYSSEQRKKTIDYFNSVIMNMPQPGGTVGVVGTPFHEEDLYASLKKKPRIWHYREYPAIFPNGKLLWSNRWSFQNIMDKREEQGNLVFSRENLCKPVNSDSTIFSFDILNISTVNMESYKLVNNRDSFPVKFVRVVLGCDFALSSSTGADYSVFVTFGLDENDRRWLLNITRLHGVPYAQQLAMIKTLHVNFKYDIIYTESNQFQMVAAQDLKNANLPVFPHNTNAKNKNDFKFGLPGLAVKFEMGKYRIPIGDDYSKDMKDMIFTEFSNIAFTERGIEGVGSHDDIPMAWWIAECAIQHNISSFGLMMI